MIESIRQVLTGNRKSIILVWQAHHNIAKWICWKDSEVKEPMPKWKAHQSTRLRLTRGKTLKEEGCINHLLIERFLASNYWKNGSFFICVLRNRCLYRTSVICFNIEKYSVDENIIFMVKSYDDNYYIWTTCDKGFQKDSVPCQAVANRLNAIELPKLFQNICRL